MLKFSEYSKIPGIKINESVIKYGNNMKVNIVYNVPVQLLNEYIEKIKGAGKNPSAFFTTEQIAEEMIKYTLDQYMKLDNLPIEVIVGEQEPTEEKKEEEKTEEKAEAPPIETEDKEEVKVEEVDSAADTPKKEGEEEEEESDYMNKYTTMGQEVSTGFKINPISQKQALAAKVGLTNNFKK